MMKLYLLAFSAKRSAQVYDERRQCQYPQGKASAAAFQL
jgi:hypothetical protein